MNFVMKKKIVFATNNAHKLREIRAILGQNFEVISLKELEIYDDIPETSDTLPGNALQKAEFVFNRTGLDCFADDTGLEVDSLNGEPGVYSARYAGEDASFDDNMNKLLAELGAETNRQARFRTVIALIMNKQEHFFEGSVEGEILKEKAGGSGFGYDPIFRPKGYNQSFAEMSEELKNKISHRGLAVQKLEAFLRSVAES
jgi:XTP/dITP diphosphohydrolase